MAKASANALAPLLPSWQLLSFKIRRFEFPSSMESFVEFLEETSGRPYILKSWREDLAKRISSKDGICCLEIEVHNMLKLVRLQFGDTNCWSASKQESFQ